MAFAVVLDTCVLYPAHLRDSLLRFAERGLYLAHWSDDILTELGLNLAKAGVAQPSIEHLLDRMEQAFPHAEVRGYQPLVSTMTCDEKDRQVLAAAVRTDAAATRSTRRQEFCVSRSVVRGPAGAQADRSQIFQKII